MSLVTGDLDGFWEMLPNKGNKSNHHTSVYYIITSHQQYDGFVSKIDDKPEFCGLSGTNHDRHTDFWVYSLD